MTIALSWQPLPARLRIAGVCPVPTNLGNDLQEWIFAVADKPAQHADRIISRLNLRFTVDEAPPPPQGTEPTQLLLHNSTHSYSARLRKALAYNTADRRASVSAR